MNYTGRRADLPSARGCVFVTIDEAEQSFPGCSVYWDRDMEQWGSDNIFRLYVDGGEILTAMRKESQTGGEHFAEYRCDPLPHWILHMDILYFNSSYVEREPFFK